MKVCHSPRRYIVPDPVVRPEAVRAKRRKADRARKIRKIVEKMVAALRSDCILMTYEPDVRKAGDILQAILEDVV
jgi:hypothetical protein